MTTISSKVIADSISPQNIRLTTLQLRYPRVIHAEFMTHRDFSRNASSSRAVPVERLIKDVMDDPYIPIHWGKNQKGMQADEECDNRVNVYGLSHSVTREDAWLYARDYAVNMARAFTDAGYHKQIVNRLLEPFSHINVVVSSTRWANFFALRDHEDAMPEINVLAKRMRAALYGSIKDAIEASKPQELEPGEWHIPYVTYDDFEFCCSVDPPDPYEVAIRMSVARCARVSYLTTEGKKPSWSEDLRLYDRLVGSSPLHATPTEHQGTPDTWFQAPDQYHTSGWKKPHLSGNFSPGWIQYRKTLPNEYVRD